MTRDEALAEFDASGLAQKGLDFEKWFVTERAIRSAEGAGLTETATYLRAMADQAYREKACPAHQWTVATARRAGDYGVFPCWGCTRCGALGALR